MPVCRLCFVKAYLKMKIFHFPIHILLLFLVLLAVVSFSFGAASYVVSIETQNEEAVVARQIVGDWVVSPVDTSGQYGGGVLGKTPSYALNNISIGDAEAIIEELNGLDGVKTLGVAGIETVYTLVFGGTLGDMKASWFKGRSYTAIDNRMQYDGRSYSTLQAFAPGDYYYDQIYGIDSDKLIAYYEGEGSYEFYGLTGRKGAFISEPLRKAMGLDGSEEYVTIAVCINDKSSFARDAADAVEVPIAGYFRIPAKYRGRPVANDWISRLSYDQGSEFLFLDMEYYSRLFTTTVTEGADIEGRSGIYDVALALFRRRKSSVTGISYQNIWVRGGSESDINTILRKFGGTVALEDSITASIEADRTLSKLKSCTFVGRFLFILTAAVMLFFARTVLGRMLDYEEKTVLLLFSAGESRRSIVFRLSLILIIPSIMAALLSFYVGIVKFGSNFSGYFSVSTANVLQYMALPCSIVMFLFLVVAEMSIDNFVRRNTVFERAGRRHRRKA